MMRIDINPLCSGNADDTTYDGIDYDKNDIITAQYAPRDGIVDDPDLCALPKDLSTQELTVCNFAPLSDYDHDNVLDMDKDDRLRQITKIDTAIYPLKASIAFAKMISSALHTSYSIRSLRCISYGDVREDGKISPGGKIISLRRDDSQRPFFGMLTGMTGTGKSLACHNAMKLYPKAIRHVITSDMCKDGIAFSYTQVPILYVTATVANFRELLYRLAEQIDGYLDTGNLHKNAMKPSRCNIGVALGVIGEWIEMYHIGLLIIDEVQFLKIDSATSVFEDIIALTEKTGVSLIMIGNADGYAAIQKRPRIYGRLKKNIIISDIISKPAQAAFDMALHDLWRYQWTDHVSKMTPDIFGQLRLLSDGNISMLKTLLVAVQTKAVSTGYEGDIDADYIRGIFDDSLEVMYDLLKHPGIESDRKFVEMKNEIYKLPDKEAEKLEEERTSKMFNEVMERQKKRQETEKRIARLTDSFMDSKDPGVSEEQVRATFTKLFREKPEIESLSNNMIINEAEIIISKTLKAAARRR